MKIYLASCSVGRINLLNDAKINFEKISHNYDEIVNQKFEKIENYVLFVAKEKIKNINLPDFKDLENKFIVLTADTMNSLPDGQIIGKPKNLEEARIFFKKMNESYFYCSTAFCLNIYEKINDFEFKIIKEFENVVISKIWANFNNEDIEKYIDFYGDKILTISSGLDVEIFGGSFIKKIEGSYSAVIGLQMCELKNVLSFIEKNYE